MNRDGLHLPHSRGRRMNIEPPQQQQQQQRDLFIHSLCAIFVVRSLRRHAMAVCISIIGKDVSINVRLRSCNTSESLAVEPLIRKSPDSMLPRKFAAEECAVLVLCSQIVNKLLAGFPMNDNKDSQFGRSVHLRKTARVHCTLRTLC